MNLKPQLKQRNTTDDEYLVFNEIWLESMQHCRLVGYMNGGVLADILPRSQPNFVKDQGFIVAQMLRHHLAVADRCQKIPKHHVLCTLPVGKEAS